jgi:AraC-like DNA-binding protein
MDVLSDVLQNVRLEGTVFGGIDLSPPWGMRAGVRSFHAFHVVARGGGWLEVEGRRQVRVAAGDVVFLKRGYAHALRDAPRSRAVPIEELLAAGAFCKRGKWRDDGTQLVCGCFRFDDLRGDTLLASLPTVIHTHELQSEVGPWLAQTVKLMAYEVSSGQPGSETVLARLCDALFIYVIRSVLSGLPDDRASWLRALVAPQVGAALRLMHERPDERWTVATLATRVGMSRSAFADRFAAVVGEGPLHYLARWRLQKAAGLLRRGDAGTAEVAARVGYDSAAAFNKAFKRTMGVTPGAWRKEKPENAWT